MVREGRGKWGNVWESLSALLAVELGRACEVRDLLGMTGNVSNQLNKYIIL